jgi:hypothetical protein
MAVVLFILAFFSPLISEEADYLQVNNGQIDVGDIRYEAGHFLIGIGYSGFANAGPFFYSYDLSLTWLTYFGLTADVSAGLILFAAYDERADYTTYSSTIIDIDPLYITSLDTWTHGKGPAAFLNILEIGAGGRAGLTWLYSNDLHFTHDEKTYYDGVVFAGYRFGSYHDKDWALENFELRLRALAAYTNREYWVTGAVNSPMTYTHVPSLGFSVGATYLLVSLDMGMMQDQFFFNLKASLPDLTVKAE